MPRKALSPRSDAKNIGKGLDTILSEIDKGSFDFKRALEDIHMNVESRLSELIGPAAGRLHTARSRNDQVATDFRLYVRDTIDETDAALAAFQHALVARALEHAGTVMPGFTHLQTAQPVTFGHHLLAYVEMAARDRGRFADARKRLNESPLGAAALAGTSFPIDRDGDREGARLRPADGQFARRGLRPRLRAGDPVGGVDRGGASVALRGGNRDLDLAAGRPGAALSDKFTTGSSIMPQKRNPDAAELVRAKTGRVIGALTGLLIVMKGLPLAYQKDMQEDKQGAMEAFGALSLAIRAMTGMVEDLVPDEARMKAAAGEGYATATDLADWLVRTLKMPFRDAHHVTGRIVGLASKQGVALHELPLKAMQEVEPKITAEALKVLSVEVSGEKPDQLWRHRAEERAGAGQSLGEAAGKRAKIGLRPKISLQFHGYPGSRPRQSTAIFVWCGPHWGFRRDQ